MGGVTTGNIGAHFEWTGSTSQMIKYYYAGGQRVAMRVGSNAPSYLLGDHLGSTSLTTNSSGSKVAELRYYPYGETRFSSGTTLTDRQFTGQINDVEIGLYFYNARYYDSALGRFIQADTIVPSPANPQSFNRYSYVLNNALKYTDPTGHRECGEFCDPSEMGTTEDEPNPYVDWQPETNTGYGEIVDFLTEPFLALHLPRFEVQAWNDSRFLFHISCWAYDYEIEIGQSLSGRLGSGRAWLLKDEKLRLYSSDGQSWIAVGPNEIAYSPRMVQLPRPMTGRGARASGEIRGVSALKLESGAVQYSGTVEWTSIYQIPGVQTRETKYIRVASNTYYRRYAATVVDVAGIVAVGKVLTPLFSGTVIKEFAERLPAQ